MNENDKSAAQARAGLPMYLAMQFVTLVMTFLEFPMYMETFRILNSNLLTPWVGLWFVLEVFGLVTAVSLLFIQRWRGVLPEKERVRLAAGYFLGLIAGLVTFGLRFLLSQPYYSVVGLLLIVLGGAYYLWNRRRAKREEIFP